MNVKHTVLLAAGVISLATGAFAQLYFPDPSVRSPFEPALVILGTMLVFIWYHADVTERKYKRSVWRNLAVVLLAGIALPYYFFWSRGFKNGLLATGAFLLFLILFALLQVLGGWLAYGFQP